MHLELAYFQGLFPQSFQPSFFSITSCLPRVSGGFLETRIPGKNEGGTPRVLVGKWAVGNAGTGTRINIGYAGSLGCCNEPPAKSFSLFRGV